MKYSLLLLVAVPAAIGQVGTASIQGTVVDARTQQPVPAALVLASRVGVPPFVKNTKSGGDGAFQIQGLTGGSYSLCVQAPGETYLDPCQWDGSPTAVTLVSGQAVAGVHIALAPASVLTIQVRDVQKVLSQSTLDGRRPELSVGVWGAGGLYHPVHLASGPAAAAAPEAGLSTYTYRLAVPRGAALNLHIASRDLKLGDANGVALPTNTSRQAFQIATGDTNPKGFTFSVLGLLP